MKKILSAMCAVALTLTAVLTAPVGAEAEPPSLRADSALIYTKAGDAVCGTNGAITAEALAAEFDSAVTVKKADGTVLEGGKKVPTGSVVASESGSVPVLISGDANVDGNINLADVSAMLKVIAKWDTAIDMTAAMVTGGAKLSLGDVSAILKFIAGWDVRLGSVKIVVNEEPVAAAEEDGGMELWLDSSMTKLPQANTESSGLSTYVIYAAKNESEDALLYVAPDKDYAGLQISVTDFKNCYGDTVEAEAFAFHYVKMGRFDYMPDATMPDESTYEVKVKAGNSQGYLVRANTTEESEAGLYEATVSLTCDGAEVKRAKVYLFVWDFTLKDEDACDTAFGMDRYGLLASEKPDASLWEEEDLEDYYATFYDFLLDYRLNSFTIPYGVSHEKGQAYLDDPRVTTFAIGGDGYSGDMDRTDEELAEYYEILTEHPEWLEKGYFYYIDEPLPDERLPENYEKYFLIGDTYNTLQEKFPGGRQMIPLETCAGYNLTDDFYQATKGFVQVYCPKTYAFTPEKYRGTAGAEVFLTAEDTEKYGTFEEVIDSWVADGTIHKLWWYLSCSTNEPYANYHASSEGILPRVVAWQQYSYDVTGLLYYAVSNYGAQNPYRSINYADTEAYGDGILIYPGTYYGLDIAVPSLRLAYIRDGIEDYMYLTMAERLIGEDAVNEILLTVTRDMIDFTRDPEVLLAARCALAEAIIAAEAE